MSSASVLNGSIMAMLAIALVFEDETLGTSEATADASPVIEADGQTTDDGRKS